MRLCSIPPSGPPSRRRRPSCRQRVAFASSESRGSVVFGRAWRTPQIEGWSARGWLSQTSHRSGAAPQGQRGLPPGLRLHPRLSPPHPPFIVPALPHFSNYPIHQGRVAVPARVRGCVLPPSRAARCSPVRVGPRRHRGRRPGRVSSGRPTIAIERKLVKARGCARGLRGWIGTREKPGRRVRASPRAQSQARLSRPCTGRGRGRAKARSIEGSALPKIDDHRLTRRADRKDQRGGVCPSSTPEPSSRLGRSGTPTTERPRYASIRRPVAHEGACWLAGGTIVRTGGRLVAARAVLCRDRGWPEGVAERMIS